MTRNLKSSILLLCTSAILLFCQKETKQKQPELPPAPSPEPGNREVGIDVVVKAQIHPWGMVVLPDGDILYTLRGGYFYRINAGDGRSVGLATRKVFGGEGGLLGLALDPEFEKNDFVYAYETSNTNQVVRYKYDNGAMTENKIIVTGIPRGGIHNGGVVQFGPDGYLYIGTGDADKPTSQDLNSLGGKILRVDRDGLPALGNPFDNMVWSYGHRNVQGLTWGTDGTMYATEHGPIGHDELNIIEKGKNYGWPGSFGGNEPDGYQAPMVHSGNDTWAPSGCLYTDASHFWPRSVIVACLGGKKLARFKLSEDGKTVIGRADTLEGNFGRIRNVIKGPGGELYICTSNGDDQILRIWAY